MRNQLKTIDHQILLGLIRGESIKMLAHRLEVGVSCINQRLARARQTVEVDTTYQLVALEVINLMEDGQLPKYLDLLPSE